MVTADGLVMYALVVGGVLIGLAVFGAIADRIERRRRDVSPPPLTCDPAERRRRQFAAAMARAEWRPRTDDEIRAEASAHLAKVWPDKADDLEAGR